MADNIEDATVYNLEATSQVMRTKSETAFNNGTSSSMTVSKPLHELISEADKAEAQKQWVLEKANAEIVGKRGEEIYQQHIKREVEAAHRGKYLILDVDTGCYEVDTENAAASLRIYEHHPDARLYTVRIGYPSAVKV